MEDAYQQTLDWLYAQLPMYQRQGQTAFKKDLTNIQRLLAAMHDPHREFVSIHVGGTNGKGTVTHLLSAAFQAAGWRVGRYISPHYRDFRERITIDGRMIPRQQVVTFVQNWQEQIDQIQPSFFELTVAMAFQYFAEAQVDIAIIEVGLGGRLDSTNVLTPAMCIITNIGLDHQNMLGDTLPAIAAEKAGIIKSGIPVVVGQRQSATTPVFHERAQVVGAPLYFAEDEINIMDYREEAGRTFVQTGSPQQFIQWEVDLSGPFQQENIRTALAALHIWNQTHVKPLPVAAIQDGLARFGELTGYQGRWQQLGQRPLVIADSAHNEPGLRIVTERLRAMKYNHLHIVLGVVNDKELSNILPLLPVEATYYFAKANIPRGLPADRLRDLATGFGLHGQAFTSVEHALRTAQVAAAAEDVIFVGGSIFTVAEVLTGEVKE